jgi:hypothetical protein
VNSRAKLFTWLAVALAALLVIVFLGWDRRSDKQLIQEAIDESVLASKEGRPGGVLEYISNSFTMNQEGPVDRREIAKFIKESKPDVEVGPFEPNVTGDVATIRADVSVKISTFGPQIQLPGVSVKFRKEHATRWLLFPTKKWRIVEAIAPEVPELGALQY